MKVSPVVLVVFLILLAGAQAWAAGPIGHALLSNYTADQIRDGTLTAPPELQEALQTPEGQKAFAGGSVAPDICEAASHYGNTAELARAMIEDARSRLEEARQTEDPELIAKAGADLAFAYGWLSHCASDLNVHPRVNAIAGDTYRFCDTGQKAVHAAQEAQLTAYLRSISGGDTPKYDTYIPYDLVSRHTGVSEADLVAGNLKLRGKAMAEIAAADLVTVTPEMVDAWEPIKDASLSDADLFISNPDSMDNWDLDSGRISSDDFDNLRDDAITANGGTLPEDWGKNYLAWYEEVKNLSRDQWIAKLKELLGTQGTTQAIAAGEPVWVCAGPVISAFNSEGFMQEGVAPPADLSLDLANCTITLRSKDEDGLTTTNQVTWQPIPLELQDGWGLELSLLCTSNQSPAVLSAQWGADSISNNYVMPKAVTSAENPFLQVKDAHKSKGTVNFAPTGSGPYIELRVGQSGHESNWVTITWKYTRQQP